MTARPASPWISEGIIIFVALPSAALPNASRLLSATISFVGAASLSILMLSASALCTALMASASPAASRIFCSFTASARSIADSFSPSAIGILLRFSPSASSIDSRFSRSAFIWRSIAAIISCGGTMFLTSTRFTLMPHLSVALSSVSVMLELIWSRDVSV